MSLCVAVPFVGALTEVLAAPEALLASKSIDDKNGFAPRIRTVYLPLELGREAIIYVADTTPRRTLRALNSTTGTGTDTFTRSPSTRATPSGAHEEALEAGPHKSSPDFEQMF